MVNFELNPNNFYGLIIGNNNYPNRDIWFNLKGAEIDARRFKEYLSENLKVPDGNLKLMLNATRDETISIFKELQRGKLHISRDKSVQIPRDSTFVFFYAGHGGRTPIPEGWTNYHTTDGQVEQIIPTDIGEENKEGIVVEGIPDRTVAAVLNGLVSEIGENVTVILDCCHSAGQTRRPKTDQHIDFFRPRRLLNLPPLGSKCDADIVSRERTRGARVGLRRAMRCGIEDLGGGKKSSYILLAACQQDQLAFDVADGGVFTKKLLSILQSESLDHLTYAGLMLKMKMSNQLQTPVCFGPNQNRIIFTTKEGRRSDDCFIGEFSEHWESDVGSDAKIPIVFGGVAHGICEGDKFKLYDISREQKYIGEAKVHRVFSTCAQLSIVSKNPELESNTYRDPFYCRLARDYSTMKVFCNSTQEDLLSSINTEDVKFTQALNPEEATIIISDDKQYPSYVQLSFRPGCVDDENIFKDGIGARFTEIIRKDRPTRIRDVLISMFRFYSLLYTCKKVPEGWENIDIKFVSVKEAFRKDGDMLDHIRYPDYNAFCHSMKNQGDVATIKTWGSYQYVADKDREYYGMSITNNTEMNLFAYVLRLDPGEMRIDPWHLSTFHTPDIPFYQGCEKAEVAAGIKTKGTLAVGFGNSDVDPISFVLDKGIKEDRTYFKIILTTSPADFSMLIQTHNPLHQPSRSRAGASMTRSNTARDAADQNSEYTQYFKAVKYARDEQRTRREENVYYSVNLTVRQIPK